MTEKERLIKQAEETFGVKAVPHGEKHPREMSLDEIVDKVLSLTEGRSPVNDVKTVIGVWAVRQCKITARNVRHRACEIYYDAEDDRDPDKRIMNIQFSEVTPFKYQDNE